MTISPPPPFLPTSSYQRWPETTPPAAAPTPPTPAGFASRRWRRDVAAGLSMLSGAAIGTVSAVLVGSVAITLHAAAPIVGALEGSADAATASWPGGTAPLITGIGVFVAVAGCGLAVSVLLVCAGFGVAAGRSAVPALVGHGVVSILVLAGGITFHPALLMLAVFPATAIAACLTTTGPDQPRAAVPV